MRAGVVINEHATLGRNRALPARLRPIFQEAGIEAEIIVCHREQVAQTAAELAASGATALAAGGGDGTVGTVAEFCARSGIPLGVLPLGSRNHFARDLGLDLRLEEAVRYIANGTTRRVDFGRVNGRIFVNNASVGAYPRLVQERNRLREQYAIRKHVAGMMATLRVFARKPVVQARISVDGTEVVRATPFIFVGNNEYSVDLFSVRLRASVTAGKLCIYTTSANGTGGLVRLLWLSLLGRLEQARDFEMRTGKVVQIALDQETVRVATDGEISRMPLPLRFEIVPQGLEVFVPA